MESDDTARNTIWYNPNILPIAETANTLEVGNHIQRVALIMWQSDRISVCNNQLVQ